jgi:predicted enzyme related to lactoylglutathione lyase
MAEPRTYPAGVTSWVDIEHRDVEGAMAFYGGLFGWTFEEATPPGLAFRYVIARQGGLDAAGIGGPADPADATGAAASITPDWNTYVAVQDADSAAARVEAAGGRVLEAPAEVGEAGRSARCADPWGVPFRLWQARRRLGAQTVNAPGTWNFSDLHAGDPAASAAFYTAVFGWSFDDLGFATMIRVQGYGAHLAATSDPDIYTRQAEVDVPPGFADAIGWLSPADAGEKPHWHVAFAVDDRDSIAAVAERLGGTVLHTEDTAWTRTALLRDPQGAEFTASQFAPG